MFRSRFLLDLAAAWVALTARKAFVLFWAGIKKIKNIIGGIRRCSASLIRPPVELAKYDIKPAPYACV